MSLVHPMMRKDRLQLGGARLRVYGQRLACSTAMHLSQCKDHVTHSGTHGTTNHIPSLLGVTQKGGFQKGGFW